MRKSRVVGFAIAGILFAGTIAEAQSATSDRRPRRHAVERGGRVGDGLLRGITLSDAEKARVEAIHTRYVAEAKPLRDSLRPALQKLRAARQARDSAAVRVALEKARVEREKFRTVMERQRAEIRSALTPENQKSFDANAKTLEQRRAEWSKKGEGMRGDRPGRRGRRGVSQG
jgi:Spy/CpxP family protein refolding chaperone